MFRTWSVRRRLATLAWATALGTCLVVAIVVTGLAYVLFQSHEVNHAASAARRVAFEVERNAPGDLRPVSDIEAVDLSQVVDDQGKVRQASPRLVGEPPLTTARPPGPDGRIDLTTCTAARGCLNVVGVRVLVDGKPWMAYAYTERVPWYISPFYVLGLLLYIAFAVSAATWLTSSTVARALAPVKNIQNELAEITATDLGRRVPHSEHQDEIDELADTVNATLDRLEAAVEQQRRFASDASHDLRSPITAMRAQVEEALLHPADADWPLTGEALLVSLDRLQAIVTDLLTLARLDAGAPGRKDSVDLSMLVEEELSRRPRGKVVALRLAPGVVVAGDRLRLSRLLTNLLDNAERHAESTITVSVGRRGGDAVLEVRDDGAGITPEEREMVFLRFTRLDASRNRDAGGTGLGLAIAREVAKAHGGTLKIEDSDTGARFVLHIPINGS